MEVELVVRVRAALVAAAVVGGVVLGGCSAQPGTAAVIDGRSISQDTLNTTVEELAPLLQTAEPRAVLAALMVAPFFIEAADENEVGISESQTRQLMDGAAEQSGVPATDWSDASVELVRFSLAQQSLLALPDGAEIIGAVEDEIFAAPIDVNPRYGRLDPETGQVEPLDLPWITAGADGGTEPADGTEAPQDRPTQE